MNSKELFSIMQSVHDDQYTVTSLSGEYFKDKYINEVYSMPDVTTYFILNKYLCDKHIIEEAWLLMISA